MTRHNPFDYIYGEFDDWWDIGPPSEYCVCPNPDWENMSLFRVLLVCKKCDKRQEPRDG